MVRIGILGATGYTAQELIQILLRHPHAEIVALTSRAEDHPHVTEVHPQLTGRLDLQFEQLDTPKLTERCDCVFSCLPHAASASIVKQVVDTGTRVVDFSADYRLGDVATYTQWYGNEHPDPDRVGHVPYGMPELFRADIATAALVANPGCNPTGPILALTPLLQHQIVEPTRIVVDAKCGVSGAGRNPKLATHFPECNESVTAYNVGHHRHTPEFNHVLGTVSRQAVQVGFVPHLVPMDRGILTAIYLTPTKQVSQEEVLSLLGQHYADEPFIRVVDHLPATKHVTHTNYVDITVRMMEDQMVVLTAIDNLVKGASGAAVQNFNVMFGFDETTALLPA